MSFFREFRSFISRGNVIDMAVGIMIGASFSKIVNTLVNNVLMPPLGLILGGMDFGNLKITLKKGSGLSPAVTIDYGLFINSLVDFLIITGSIFILIKIINSIYHVSFPQITCPECQMHISSKAKRCPHCTSNIKI